jgi:hypothetical protein
MASFSSTARADLFDRIATPSGAAAPAAVRIVRRELAIVERLREHQLPQTRRDGDMSGHEVFTQATHHRRCGTALRA